MAGLHGAWAWVATASTGVVGLWGLVQAVRRRPIGRWFRVAMGWAVASMLIQAGLGLVLYGQGERPGSEFHVFYGFVILFTLAFAYIFRAQMARRPALAWGILLLFVMGLGLRAWAKVGI